jgi:AraC family transcriptional regulator
LLQLLCGYSRNQFLVKIAIELERAVAHRAVNGLPGNVTPRLLARARGWKISDVVCTSGPQDCSFEEQHSWFSIAVVAAGSFQYRCKAGRELMTPGSLLLGNAGEYFECGHEHAGGDRCISFQYAPDYFESLELSARGFSGFGIGRLPPLRALSPLVAQACGALAGYRNISWEELSILFAGRAAQLISGVSARGTGCPPGATARVTQAVRMIERHVDAALDLQCLAREARLSPYHFLRTFTHLTGLTPHQYILRGRLREAALRLADAEGPTLSKVLDIALDCGFGDVSNFNRAFRAEFGMNPRAYRMQPQGRIRV